MSCIKSHPIYDHFKKYSGVPFYFKTSRDKLQPWTRVLEKNPPFLRFNVALEIVSINCVDNPNIERGHRGNFPRGYCPAIPIRVCGATGVVILGLLI